MTISKFKPYLNYSDKEIGWLGKIPRHWDISTPRLMFEEIKDKNTESARTNFLSLVSKKGIIPYKEKGSMGNKMSVNIDHYTMVNKGDFVLNSMNFGIGGFGVSPYDGITSPAYVVLRPIVEESMVRYLAQIFEDEGFQKGTAILGDGILELRRAIGWKHLKRQPIPIPTHEERMAIVRFLDFGKDTIDELVPALQNLIIKLKEKRSALITEAVTKGLNPDVKMRDSGIEWLGDVPEHWKVVKLRYLLSHIGSGKTPKGGAEIYQETGIPFIRSQNVHFAGLKLENVSHISEKIDAEMNNSRVFGNDVLLNITGASLGKCCYVPSSFKRANVNQHVCILRPIETKISPKLLNQIMASSVSQGQISSEENGSSREGLNFQQIADLVVAIPSNLDEQNSLVEHLDQLTSIIDNISNKIDEQIKELKEYRMTMFSAAVTGKIDVRGMT